MTILHFIVAISSYLEFLIVRICSRRFCLLYKYNMQCICFSLSLLSCLLKRSTPSSKRSMCAACGRCCLVLPSCACTRLGVYFCLLNSDFVIPILHCVIHAMYLFSSWCDGVRLGVRLTSFSCGRMRGGGFAFSLAPPGSGSQCFPCAVCNRPPLRGKGKGAHARLVQPDPARLGQPV